MAPVVAGSGTQTAVIGTEHTLLTQSSAKTCVLNVSLTNMVLGDVVTLAIYNKGLTGDTITTGTLPNLLYSATYSHNRAEPQVQSVPVPVAYGAVFTLLQSAGTGRAFPWHVVTLD
jgi:hypothetical protein